MKLLEELKERGLVEALTDPEIEKALEKPMTVYCGFDPSARSLQAGNLVSIMVLKRFQMAGHKVIALVGGATGLIGDPSGKSAERNMLTVEQVEENKKGIRENLSRILDFDGPNAATLVDNYDWYKGTSAIEFLRDIAINFRVPQMLAKESVKKRLEASEGALTFTEFSYQILQGNDFLHLYDNFGCQMEVGGRTSGATSRPALTSSTGCVVRRPTALPSRCCSTLQDASSARARATRSSWMRP